MQLTDQKLNTQYTMILGAEGELGRALAREIARKGSNLLLISTTSIDLQRFAIGLQLKEDIEVDAVKLDLSDQEAIREFGNKLRTSYEIHAMINNITCDWSPANKMCVSELSREDALTRFRGSVLLTWSILPQMSTLPTSYLQHIIPFPFRKEQFNPEMQLAISKMYAFTRELDNALRDTGVLVSMVHPAPLKSMMQQMEYSDGVFEPEVPAFSPSLIALKAVNGMLRGDRLIIPGLWNRIQFILNHQLTNWFRSPLKGLESTLQASV